MRAVLLCLLVAGCGKPALVPVEEPLPMSLNPARTDATSLHNHYWNKAPFFEPHKHEGKKIIVAVEKHRVSVDTDSEGGSCILFDADDGVKRPAIVFRVTDSKYQSAIMDGRTKYIEGTLKGVLPFEPKTLGAKWVKREPQPLRMPDHFVFLDGCQAVVGP